MSNDKITTSLCRGCGKPIVWAKNKEGKSIPLDPRPPVYAVTEFMGAIGAERREQSMVSHFSTCSHANEFSASNRRKP